MGEGWFTNFSAATEPVLHSVGAFVRLSAFKKTFKAHLGTLQWRTFISTKTWILAYLDEYRCPWGSSLKALCTSHTDCERGIFFQTRFGKAAEWNLFAKASVQISKNVCTGTSPFLCERLEIGLWETRVGRWSSWPSKKSKVCICGGVTWLRNNGRKLFRTSTEF